MIATSIVVFPQVPTKIPTQLQLVQIEVKEPSSIEIVGWVKQRKEYILKVIIE